ncbi:MAG: transglutaminase-like cysteine peptidase [Bauldia sp.]|nr:transglutaminase-like cysteine peptidase [Bauldia sp.]
MENWSRIVHISFLLLAAATSVVAFSSAALAQSVLGSSMATGGITSQPIGHYEFCALNRSECRRTPVAQPVGLTDATFAQLDAVNRHVNESVVAVTDAQLYNLVELWTYPTGAGDCEDFVLLKRQLLAAAGWPLSSLLITMVFQANGEGHAVLTVRTDHGDFILDNLSNEVRLWTDTPYIYIKRQSDRDAGTWVSISGSTMIAGNIAWPAAPAPAQGNPALLGNIGG